MSTSTIDARTRSIARRCAASTAAALTTMAATIMLAPAAHAATVERPVENASAGAAVVELTSGAGSTAVIPADFAAGFGYRPAVVDGLVVNPGGECSSPVTLPNEFETACKAHDLGYDLLRYAAARDQPLGGWARQALDATLAAHMHEACAAREDGLSRARCDVMASIASTFVDLNSRRQDYGAPVVESTFGAGDSGRSGWIVGGGLIGLGAAGFLPSVRRRLGSAGARCAGGFTNHLGTLMVQK
ncbi:hypothetical protein [Nocardia anaemiae]|uniref:hypothetical protein n=1 Tax=Nocardia anaemiae TaxID=263910 RepID=UPI0007A511FD|nr:hypothetical protein [Nocardia anaemiae]